MRKVVIAPRESQKFLLKRYRSNDIFSDVKFYTKEEIIKGYKYTYTNDALVYLIEKHDYSYEMAKIMLENLILIPETYSGTNKKIIDLLSLQKDLYKNNLLIKNEYFDFELSSADINVHYYSKNDFVLKKYLSNKKINFVKDIDNKPECIRNFPSVEDELFCVMNEISSLLNNGVEPSKIKIANISDDYLFPLKRMARNYGININGIDENPAIAMPIVKHILDNFEELYNGFNYQEFFKDYEKYESLPDIILMLKQFRIAAFSLQKQRKLYEDIFKSKIFKTPNYKEAITVVDEPYANRDEYLFIVNFAQSKFPLFKKDDGYLSNDELDEIGEENIVSANSSKNDEALNALTQNANIFLSCPDISDGQSNLKSPYVDILDLKILTNEIPDNVFNIEEFHIWQANLKDLCRKYRHKKEAYFKSILTEDLPYQDYTYEFKGVNFFTFTTVNKFSYSSFNQYQSCAFSYFLDKVLALKQYKHNFKASFGTIVHEILENIDTNISFDALFDKVLKKTKNLNDKDIFMTVNLKDDIEHIYNLVKQQENSIENKTIYRERKPDNVPLSDYVTLTGKIDKSIVFGDNVKYVALLDYKTGEKAIEEDKAQFGLSNQLPFYALITNLDNNPKTVIPYDKILGFYIQPIMYSSFDKKDSDFKLKGKTIDDIEIIKMFDKSMRYSNESELLANVKHKNGAFSARSQCIKNEEWFDNIVQKTRDLLLEAGSKIQNNEFIINPKAFKGANVSCTYCQNKDICFSDYKAVVTLDNGDEEETINA